MARLDRVSQAARLRARRWDALVLGSGTAALIAAARLGGHGQRVLVIEEDAARASHPALREPFFLSGMRDQGPLDQCLRELGIPLIDRRRIEHETLAYQVANSKLRLDVGPPELTQREWVRWGLCPNPEAGPVMRALAEAGEVERQAMLNAPLVRVGRRLGLGRMGTAGSHMRGLPSEVANPPAILGTVLDATVAALSNLAQAQPTPEARVRLLAAGLAGGAGFGDDPPWLMGLLRRRVEAVHGEFRSVAGPIGLVCVGNNPGITVEGTDELWLGRAILLTNSPSTLASALGSDQVPSFLRLERPTCQRIAAHLRVERDAIPRAMAPRVILPGEGDPEEPSGRTASLTAFKTSDPQDEVDLIVRIRARSGEEIGAIEEHLMHRVQAIMPFSEGRMELRPQRRPLWDDDRWLEDPKPGSGWPAELDLKVSGRPPVYRLDRAAVAALGFEGDVLLGWKGGDAIARELG